MSRAPVGSVSETYGVKGLLQRSRSALVTRYASAPLKTYSHEKTSSAEKRVLKESIRQVREPVAQLQTTGVPFQAVSSDQQARARVKGEQTTTSATTTGHEPESTDATTARS